MAYIDSRGVEMEEMEFIEALQMICEIAGGKENGLSSNDEWYDKALETLRDFCLNHEDDILTLELPEGAQDWPEHIWEAKPIMDPNHPVDSIRIVLQAAENHAISPSVADRSIDFADMCDQQQQAFDVVRDLIGGHGLFLEEIQSNNRLNHSMIN